MLTVMRVCVGSTDDGPEVAGRRQRKEGNAGITGITGQGITGQACVFVLYSGAGLELFLWR